MNDASRTVFRPDALRRYSEGLDRSVLPRVVAPRTFVALWLLLGALTATGAATWSTRVPIYASGTSVVVEPSGDAAAGGETALVALLPAAHREDLHPGQPVFLDLEGGGTRTRRVVLTVEPEITSPSAARRRFGLDPTAGSVITAPVVVVFIEPAPLPSGLPLSAYGGSVHETKVQLGTRRLLSLVSPLRLLGG